MGSEVDILINGLRIGHVKYGASHSFKEKIFRKINIQQWSKIELKFRGDNNAMCRVEKLTPCRYFEGEIMLLEKTLTLQVFEAYNNRQMGCRLFSDYVKSHFDSVKAKRRLDFAELNDSEEWKARQADIRMNLHRHFGKFPQRTPLNAKVISKLERENYTIETVI